MEIDNRLKKILCVHSQLDVLPEEITEDTNIVEDLGVNSIELIMLMVDIENQYGIDINEEKIDIARIYDIKYLNEIVIEMIGR